MKIHIPGKKSLKKHLIKITEIFQMNITTEITLKKNIQKRGKKLMRKKKIEDCSRKRRESPLSL